MSEILPSCGWGLGPNNLGQKTLTYTTYGATQKNRIPKPIFFSLQTARLSKSFEGLNSSLAQLTGELWSCNVAQK